MNHGAMTSSTTMAMGGMATGSATSGMAMPTTSTKPMSMGMGNGCKISMLWNWNTIDACFISSQWRITSKGMFAGSCIGVILLVMSLELLRRASKEYDRYLIRSHSTTSSVPASFAATGDSKTASGEVTPIEGSSTKKGSVRPTILQQSIRATLHMVQFTIAYFVMLLAMYYNGYLIISIIIGAWLGAFVFSWGNLDIAGPKEDSTYCCG